MVDHYQVLGVQRDASSDDIKAAFRRLALKFHPDRHANASQSQQQIASHQFRQAKEAYEVLGDERQRAIYNRYGGAQYGYGSSSNTSSSRSYRPSSTYSGYTGYQSGQSSGTEWQGSTYNNSSSSYNYGARRTKPDYNNVRWGSWTVRASEGPRLMVGVTLFGMAICTMMLMNALHGAAWHRKNNGKSYEEMLERLEHEKRIRREGEGKNKGDK